MPRLSPFQCLPLHIAESIGYYYSLPKHAMSCRYEHNENNKQRWSVLFDVSLTWRMLAIKNIFGNIDLELEWDSLSSGYGAVNMSRTINESCFDIRPHVQSLDLQIRIDDRRIYSRKPKKSNKGWSDDLVFPVAHTLRIDDNHRYCGHAENIFKNEIFFTQLMHHIRTSLPNIRNIEFESDVECWFRVDARQMLSDERNTVSFLDLHYRGRQWYNHRLTDPVYLANSELALQNSPDMVDIRFSTKDPNKYFHQLIKRSANTLVSIHATERNGARIKDFTTRDDGSPIAYPNLKTLKLSSYYEEKYRIVIAGPVAPFMALQRLEISPVKLVDDTALADIDGSAFRSISISVDPETLDLLKNHKAFASGKFPQLCHISADEHYQPQGRLETDHFMKYVFGFVAPATQHLAIFVERPYQLVMDDIQSYPNLQHIQILELKRSYLYLREMLEIIKCLPNMTSFGCELRGFGPGVKKQKNKTIPDILRSKYYPLSHRLKYWAGTGTLSVGENTVAVSAIALAILCPNFICVEVSTASDRYDSKLKELLDSGLYDEHAATIKRLLYN